MAAGLDLAFVGCEIGLLAAATERVRKEIAGYCRWSIGGTMLVSAGLNGLAFGAAATDWYMYPAVGLGVSVPGLIYLLSRVSFTLASRRSKPRRSDPGGFSVFRSLGGAVSVNRIEWSAASLLPRQSLKHHVPRIRAPR